MIVKADHHEEDIRLLLQRLPEKCLRNGVIHVGAHVGEEVAAYFEAGFQRVLLFEANPECCQKLELRFRDDSRVQIANCAISEIGGQVTLHLHTSRTGSTEPASLFQMKELSRIVKNLTTPRSIDVEAFTLDQFLAEHEIDAREIGLLNLDIQGAELRALKGATKTLATLAAVITEVNVIELYAGGSLEEEIVSFMALHNFMRAYTIYHTLYEGETTFPAWGESLFLKV
jgi:FkbM family methyltransferase